MLNNIENLKPTDGIVAGQSEGSNTVNPNELAIQQMHALEPLGWKGGDHFWDGPHDAFCFVCGSPKDLFACQTCENCYHAECMTPSLDQNEVPAFWFCPHCVGNELHIPPMPEENFFSPLPSSLPIYQSSNSASTIPLTNTNPMAQIGIPDVNKLKGRSNLGQRTEPNVAQQPTPLRNDPSKAAMSRPRPQEAPSIKPQPGNGKVRRPRNSSPLRKKSKYSTFSKEVDKALAVIHAELETAAGYGRSEGNLETKAQALEQQLRMHEGQMLLTTRELELARKELAKEREDFAVMKVNNLELREENTRLKEDLQRKENELKDWRLKLRSMIGSEFE